VEARSPKPIQKRAGDIFICTKVRPTNKQKGIAEDAQKGVHEAEPVLNNQQTNKKRTR